jgi:hypothetical protein
MNWISIAVGAGAGVLAVLVSAGLMKLIGKSSDSAGARVVYVVVFALAMAGGREFVAPSLLANAMESALLELPVYKALKEHEPEAYQRVLQAFEFGASHDRPKEETYSETRSIISEVAAKRLPHASDDVQIRFADHAAQTVMTLHAKGGDSCFSYLHPSPGQAVDFMAILGKDYATRELDLLSEAIISSAGMTRPRVSQDVAGPGLQMLSTKLQEKYSATELAALDDPKSPNTDKRKYCQITADLFGTAIALPPPNHVVIVRFLLQG